MTGGQTCDLPILVDAGGQVLRCSRQENTELFRLAIGGYGLFGVIATVRLRLAPRQKIERVVEVTDVAGIADRFAYSMTKGAVLTMTKSTAIDYMAQKVRCNCICPARIHTPVVDGYLAKNYPGKEKEMFDQLALYQPMGRMGSPHEVAETIGRAHV